MIKTHLFMSAFVSILSFSAPALEDIYNVSGKDSFMTISRKFKNLSEISKGKSQTSIRFNDPQDFNPSSKDLFEKIETKTGGDRPNHKIILGHPSTGRIFTLNTELKVVLLDLVEPWNTKANLKSFKEIVTELTQNKIEKRK